MIKNKLLYLKLGRILGPITTGLFVVLLIMDVLCKFIQITHYVESKNGLKKVKK